MTESRNKDKDPAEVKEHRGTANYLHVSGSQGKRDILSLLKTEMQKVEQLVVTTEYYK